MARTLACTELEGMEAGDDLRLLTLRTEDGVHLLPVFQLVGGKAATGLQEVPLALQTGVNDPRTWAQWLNVALPEADPPRNITLLYEGRVEEALRDARHDAWSWSS
ncbi:hypothetical protein J7E68_19240 [Microbacterium sp. ISL-103]|uniref:hypothetical protein n=1 Tax=Microbacterium sp. ISL-103 TaxID=2819156 RepID=UPI001BE6A392|nr:hypothetical protein [Microbacterium sp. ISL-103]MBT2476655.1 hypothetical protein [Microbacterium sp. ISL-103]